LVTNSCVQRTAKREPLPTKLSPADTYKQFIVLFRRRPDGRRVRFYFSLDLSRCASLRLEWRVALVIDGMAEFFAQSAARHLLDAQFLISANRWDNAVYLAGYVVECSFKELVQTYLGSVAARAYCHDLGDLQGDAMGLLRTLFPFLEHKLPARRTAGTVLETDHPERRYSANGRWTESEAREAVRTASEIYAEVIPSLVLDGLLRAEEI
jgi:HEPN domain-containing protein